MALIVAEEGPLRDSLQIVLTTLSQVKNVSTADDAPSALKMVTEQRPVLVLVDANLPGTEALNVLRAIKAGRNGCQCLVLADSKQQQQEAANAGADVVLFKGAPAAELFETIERLLANGNNKHGKKKHDTE